MVRSLRLTPATSGELPKLRSRLPSQAACSTDIDARALVFTTDQGAVFRGERGSKSLIPSIHAPRACWFGAQISKGGALRAKSTTFLTGGR